MEKNSFDRKIDKLLEKIVVPEKYQHVGSVYLIKKARQYFMGQTLLD